MENASKAVIIAGSILIFLIIATFIIIFFNKSVDSTQQLSKNQIEAQIKAHNSQFNIYEGKQRTKSEIQKMVSIVNNNNLRDGSYQVQIDLGDGISKTGNKYVFNGENFDGGNIKYYEIILKYNGKGIIDQIDVK